jgi:hypothetical protein
MARHHAAAVMTHHRVSLEWKRVDDDPDVSNVLAKVDACRSVEPTLARPDQVDHVARHVRREVGKQIPKRSPTGRPAVDEQHIGPVSASPIAHLTFADVDRALGWASKQLYGIVAVEHGLNVRLRLHRRNDVGR